jgi:hypothetical protein
MAKHPNDYELRRIRLTRRALTAVALAAVILIGILALHGNFKRPRTLPPTVELSQH